MASQDRQNTTGSTKPDEGANYSSADLERRSIEQIQALQEECDRLRRENESLTQKEALLHHLTDLIDRSFGIVIFRDREDKIRFWNKAAEITYGWAKDEVIGQVSHTFLQTQFPRPLPEIQEELLREGVWSGELIHTRRDGSTVVVDSRWTRHGDADDKASVIVEANTDIAERTRAEGPLRAAIAYTRGLIEASLDPLVTISPNGTISDVNEATIRVTGYSREELVGTDFSTYFTEPEKATIGYKIAFRQGSVLNYELEIRHRDGHTTPVLYNASVFRDESGNIAGVFAAARDVTKQKHAEDALRSAYAYNRGLIETRVDPLVTINPNGTISDVNEATVLATGFPREALIGTDFSRYFTDPEKAKAGYEQVYRDGSVTDYELDIRHKNGRTMPVLYNATTYRNEAGIVVGVFAAARDITEWKKAEEERSRLAAIVDNSDDAIIGKSFDGTVVSWNAGAERLYGYSAAEAIGRHISFLLLPGQADDIDELFDKIRSGKSVFHYETARMKKDGTTIQVSLSLSPIRDQGGALIGASTIARDITRRKKAEEAIWRASAYNRSLIEASVDPLVTINQKGKISDVNSATVRVTGIPRGELIGTDFSNYFTEPEKAKAGYEQVFRDGSVIDYELQIRHKDGHITPVLYNASVFRDESGNIAGVFAAARDITEQKRAEEALRAASAYNRGLIEASLDPFVTINSDGTISDVNDATVQVTGCSREELIGTDFSIHFTESEKAIAGYEQVFRTGSVRDYELEIPHTDGHLTPVLFNATIYRDTSGKIAGVFAAARDISQQKRAEEAIRRASAYNRSLIEASLDPLVTIHPDGTITDVNAATVRVTGRTRQELIGTDFSNYFTEPEKAKAGYEQVFRDGAVTDYELQIRHKDGHKTPVLYNASVFRDSSRNIAGVFAAARDVTEQKRAEEALRSANAYNRGLIEASLDPLVTINANGTINDVNEATVQVTGISREELIGTDFSKYFTDPDRAKAGYERVFRDGSVTNYELGIRHQDTHVTPVLYNASVFRDGLGNIAGVFAAARDISEQKHSEEALMKAYKRLDDRVKERTAELARTNLHLQNEITERMRVEESMNKYAEHLRRSNEDLERFAYISSHDLQEPIRTMITFTQLLERKYTGKLDADADEYIRYLVDGGKRMQLLILDLLEFSRINTKGTELRPTNANAVLENALSFLYSKAHENGATVTCEDLPMVIADPVQLQQVFSNLISNAIKFRRPGVPPEVHISSRRIDGMVQFSVQDNGIGIEPQYFEKIFVIFQRLHGRDTYEGSGIGLALVKRIIDRHGGKIWVESIPGAGSTFHFTIPSVESD